jgi:hypothetical protein
MGTTRVSEKLRHGRGGLIHQFMQSQGHYGYLMA